MPRTPLDEFKEAVHRRDAAALRSVLTTHADVRAAIDRPLFSFDSPALVAASDDVDVVAVLLEHGADPNRKSDWWAGGFHPLYGASDAAAERLLAGGAVADACAAAHLGRADLLSRILEADPSRVHERGGDGQTPLHFARNRQIVDMLLDAGADIEARDVDHRSTAAEWMVGSSPASERHELSRYLVERGASADIFLAAALGLSERVRAMVAADPEMLELRTSQGEYAERGRSSYHIYQWTLGPNLTPMQVAARFGHEDTLRVLQTFATPAQRLLLACHLGRSEDAHAIVRDHPGIVPALGPSDRRALAEEAWAANERAVELMMELGFDPAETTGSGAGGGNALHCAAWEGSAACVAAILRHPAGSALLDRRDQTYQGTPLGWCCHGSRNCGNPRADHALVAKLLIDAGATVDPSLTGCSPAMQAVVEAARRP